MENNLFRKKSIDKVSSPEQLNEYIRVASPSVFVVLSVVIIMLAGILAWSVFGTVETTIPALVVCENGKTICFTSAENNTIPKIGMKIVFDEKSGKIYDTSNIPVRLNINAEEYILSKGDFQKGDICYVSDIEIDGLADGIYFAKVILTATSPISFILR